MTNFIALTRVYEERDYGAEKVYINPDAIIFHRPASNNTGTYLQLDVTGIAPYDTLFNLKVKETPAQIAAAELNPTIKLPEKIVLNPESINTSLKTHYVAALYGSELGEIYLQLRGNHGTLTARAVEGVNFSPALEFVPA